ncbi:MAG: hypothetical protein QXU06_01015 [Candidatus Bathyarchaeia archaeon]
MCSRSSAAYIMVFMAALAIRIWHWSSLSCDWYGDSYHHWLISYLTMKNAFVYSDFRAPGMNLVWLPLFHYLSAIGMWATGIADLTIPKALNIVIGSACCALAMAIAEDSFGSRIAGLIGGLGLAFQPWFVGINVLGLSESLSAFLMLSSLFFYLRGRFASSSLAATLGMLTRYENWLHAALLLALGVFQRRFRAKDSAIHILSMAIVFAGWSYWSYANTGSPLYWYEAEASAVRHDVSWVLGTERGYWDLFHYFWLLNAMTAGLFVVALLAPRRDFRLRAISLFLLSIFSTASVGYYLGANLGEERFVISAVPLISILSPWIIQDRLKGMGSRALRRGALIALALILITVIPFLSQIWIFERKCYAIGPERRGGLWLKENYRGGRIFCDSPAAIYFSEIDPRKFISIDPLAEGIGRGDRILEWLKASGVRYIVWMRASYSSSCVLFPDLGDGGDMDAGEASFKLVYEDSGWELEYGAPKVLIYEVAWRR